MGNQEIRLGRLKSPKHRIVGLLQAKTFHQRKRHLVLDRRLQGQTGSTGTQASGKGKQRVQGPFGGSAQGQAGAPQYQYKQVLQWQYEQQGSTGSGIAPQQAGPQSPGTARPGQVASSPPDFTQGEQKRARETFFNLHQEGIPAAEAVNQMVAAWMRNNPGRFTSQLEAEFVLRLMLGITQTKKTSKYLHGD